MDYNEQIPTNPNPVDLAEAKFAFSRCGLGLACISVILYSIVYGATFIMSIVKPTFFEDYAWVRTVLQEVAMYLIGLPVCLFLLRKVPAMKPPEKKSLGIGTFIGVWTICMFAVIVGAFGSYMINSFLASLTGIDPSSLIQEKMLGMGFFTRIILAVIIAPIMEEFLCRKILIDRMRIYGERIAVITSGLMFGLFHGNLIQAFFASLIGIIFGYIYLRTGKLRYTMLLHFMLNGLTSVLQVLVTSLDLEALTAALESGTSDPEVVRSLISPALIGIVFIILLEFSAALVGFIMLLVFAKKVYFHPAPKELPRRKRFSTVWLNAGMAAFLLTVLGQILLTYWATSRM